MQVVFEDDLGDPETLESAAVAIRAAGTQQDVCPALPDLAGTGRTRIWTGTVTVGELSVSGTLLGHGYSRGARAQNLELSAGGELSDTTFTVNGRDYTVRSLFAAGDLFAQLDRRLRDADAAALVLHVCGETYALGEARYEEGIGELPTYKWPAGLDWSGAETRTLHLSKANSPATGAPEISGTSRVGETLSADTNSIADPDGLSGVSYAFQWIRIDGPDSAEIPGAASRTYTLTEADEGKLVRVAVRFSDDLGVAERRVSGPRTVRAASVPLACPARDPSYPAPIWSGDVTVAPLQFQGTVIAYGYSEALTPLPGFGALSDTAFDTRDGTYAIRTGIASTGGSLAFGLNSRLTEALESRLVLHVCGETYPFSEASWDSGTRRYTWPGAGLDWSSRASVALAIGGHPGDETLAVDRTDTTPPTIATHSGARTVLISGAGINLSFSEKLDHAHRPPASAFTVTADGHPVTATGYVREDSSSLQLRLSVSPLIRQGQTILLTYTDPTPDDNLYAIQDLAGNDAATFTTEIVNGTHAPSIQPGAPAITGTPRVGETLTAGPGTIDDADGVISAIYAWQWIRIEGGSETDISGATGETYVLTAEDEGRRIRLARELPGRRGQPGDAEKQPDRGGRGLGDGPPDHDCAGPAKGDGPPGPDPLPGVPRGLDGAGADGDGAPGAAGGPRLGWRRSERPG